MPKIKLGIQFFGPPCRNKRNFYLKFNLNAKKSGGKAEKRTRNCTRSRYKKRRSGSRHGNADGLSRRPEANETDIESPLSMYSIDRINEDSSSEGVETSSVRESLIEQQRSDPELSRIVQLRLTYTERPTNEEIEGEYELTQKLCNNWDALVHDDLVYRKFDSKRSGESKVLQYTGAEMPCSQSPSSESYRDSEWTPVLITCS